jgi:imidazolonepropionase-like amidohydrolase
MASARRALVMPPRTVVFRPKRIPLRILLGAIAGGVAAMALSCNAQADSSATPRPPLAIIGVTVIDVAHAQRLRSRTVLIEDGRIVAVAKDSASIIPRNAVRLDGRGKFLVPGLVDMHVHLFNNASNRPPNDWTFPLFVANGITGVREMAARPEQIAQVRHWNDEVNSGGLVAPRVLAAGIPVNGASENDVRAKVREAAEKGADFIKVFSEVPATRWRAIVDEAQQHQIPVDGHVPAAVPFVEAARAGQRTAEHLMQAYEACSSVENEMIAARRNLAGDAAVELRDQQEHEVLEKFDRSRCMQSARMVSPTPQAQVPTLVLSRFETVPLGTTFTTDPRWPLLRADEQARWQRLLAQRSADDMKLAQLRWKVSCDITRILNSAGSALLAGTDTPMPLNYPGYSLLDELELLVECGLSTAQALQATTTRPAQILNLSATSGSIDPGKNADLVLLDADPLRDIRNLRRVRAVVLAGRLLRREQLDASLGVTAQP